MPNSSEQTRGPGRARERDGRGRYTVFGPVGPVPDRATRPCSKIWKAGMTTGMKLESGDTGWDYRTLE